ELAVELEAQSADHLASVSDRGIAALAGSSTVAVLLPATMIFLGKKSQAPARRLIEAGAAVALATDYNPGTSPTMSLPLVMALGVSQLGLRHAETVMAVTINAAAALGLAADRGQIAAGCVADLVVAAVDDWREIEIGRASCRERGEGWAVRRRVKEKITMNEITAPHRRVDIL